MVAVYFSMQVQPQSKGIDMDFRFGIEHEVAFLRPNGQFADFANTTFAELQSIVDALPTYEEDYPQIRVGDAGIKRKRWYVEGFERFSQTGEVVDCPPKGIEIRTTIHDSIEATIAELKDSFEQLWKEASKSGFFPALTSFHPYRCEFIPDPPLNHFEQQRRQESPEMQTAHIPMLTQGPDLNLSSSQLSPQQIIDIGRKLTYYSPFIIPFSYSSPFQKGERWAGLSLRTFHRTGERPAAMVFLKDETHLIDSVPSLTQLARIPAETGRIEFKAFDSCGDFDLYGSLFSLLKGIILDDTLTGRATVPDGTLHKKSARLGFADAEIYDGAENVLLAATAAITDSADRDRLDRLSIMLHKKYSPAQDMPMQHEQGQSIPKILQHGYKSVAQR